MRWNRLPLRGIYWLICLELLVILMPRGEAIGGKISDDQHTPPNIVLIFIDDMGFGDIQPFADVNYETPNLNKLAKDGRKFSNFIVPSAVCSASRAGLLTGCLPERIGFRGALGPAAKIGIHHNEVTLAELCRSKGYKTACFGKWHLGRPKAFLPLQHGFDEFYGIPYSNDMWPLHPAAVEAREKNPDAPPRYPPLPMIEGNEVVDEELSPEDQKQMTKEFTRRSVEFIQENKSRPFFLYLPHPMVHVPLYSSPEFEQSSEGPFGDAVRELDWSVGEIVRTIESLDLEEQTLIIFTSDNGPWLNYGTHSGSAGPLREGKGTSWEGGIRVPAIMRWSGHIPSGTECERMASTIDLLPTIAALIDADLPTHKVDGVDISELMTSTTPPANNLFSERCIPIYYADGQLQAIRNDRWKLVFPHEYRTFEGKRGRNDGQPVPYGQAKVEQKQLYDLDSDVSESTNKYGPELKSVISKLEQEADQWRTELGDSLQGRKGVNQRPIGSLP